MICWCTYLYTLQELSLFFSFKATVKKMYPFIGLRKSERKVKVINLWKRKKMQVVFMNDSPGFQT